MEITNFTIKLIFLLLPGIFGTSVKEKLTEVNSKNDREYFVSVITIAFVSYFLVFLLFNVIEFFRVGCANYDLVKIQFFDILTNDAGINSIKYREVIVAIILSIITGITFALVRNKGWFYSFFNSIRITNASGKDVWEEIFDNNTKGNHDFIYVVDKKYNIVYGGQLWNFSPYSTDSQLYLSKVIVYTNDNPRQYLFSVDNLYLKFNPNDMVIEFKKKESNYDEK